MPIEYKDPETGASIFIPTEEEKRQLENSKDIKQIIEGKGIVKQINEEKPDKSGKVSIPDLDKINWVDVKVNYHAKGDGQTNDTIPIRDMLNGLYGEETRLPKGTYLTNIQDITNTSGLEISADTLKGAKIKFVDQTKYIRISDSGDISFNNMVIDGSEGIGGTPNRAIQLKRVKNVSFYNCTFINTGNTSIDVDTADSVQVSNCKFYNIKGNAIQLVNVKEVKVTYNNFYDVGNYNTPRAGSSIYVKYGKNVEIHGNKSYNNSDSVYYIDNCKGGHAIITNNTIRKGMKDGIKAQHNSCKVIIANNIVEDIAGDGINSKLNSYEVIIDANQVHSCCLDPSQVGTGIHGGITVGGFKNVTVTNNIVKGVLMQDTAGIWASVYDQSYGSENLIVTGNQVYYTSGWGVYVKQVKGLVLSNNILDQCCRDMLSSKVQMYLQDVTGSITGNEFRNTKTENGNCDILNEFTIKLPLSSPNIPSFYNGAKITMRDVELTTITTVTADIMSYNPSTKEITISTSVNSLAGSVEYQITNISHQPTYQVRFYDAGSKPLELLFMSNKLVKGATDYIRDDKGSGSVVYPSTITSANMLL